MNNKGNHHRLVTPSKFFISVVAISLMLTVICAFESDLRIESISVNYIDVSYQEVAEEQNVQEKFKTEVVLSEMDETVEKLPATEISIEEIIEDICPEMDISGVSGITESDFVVAMENCEYDKAGILKQNSKFIWKKCQEFNINEFAVVGIIAAESMWANPQESNLTLYKKNIMSIKNNSGEYKEYQEYYQCIENGIQLLSEEYVSESGSYATGGCLIDIGATYNSPDEANEWANLVAECAEMSTRALISEEE